MRPDGIIVTTPALDDDPGFLECVEDLAVEQFVPKLGVEALDVAVLPGRPRRDVGRLRTNGRDPCLDGLGDELGAIIRPNMAGNATQDEQVGEDVDHVSALQLASDPDRQALAGELVDHVQHPDLPPIVCSGFHEVVGPDVVRALRTQPDARAVVEPEAAPLRLPCRNLQPLPSPDPLDPLEIHRPAGRPQHRGDPTIAIAAVLDGERDDVGRESRLVVRGRGDLALRRAVLPEHTARHALGHAVLGHHMLDAGTAASGAQKFPAAASRRISFSIVRSETARRSRVFSASSSFKRFT